MTNRQLFKQLGKRILREREKRGWTQEDLAARVKSSRVSISLVESGHNACTVVKLLKLAKALGVPVSKLLPSARG